MLILVVASTEMEINDFLLDGLSHLSEAVKVDILITGIGTPAAIFHLTKQLSAQKYDYIIQAGIAGSFSRYFKLGEVVLIEKDCFSDLGVQEKNNFRSLFQTGLEDPNTFPYQNGWLINSSQILNRSKLKKVTGVTINTISDSKKKTRFHKQIFKAQVETMEGAALHYVCIQLQQQFIQLRSISNKVGERDKDKWDMRTAISNLNKELLKTIQLIASK